MGGLGMGYTASLKPNDEITQVVSRNVTEFGIHRRNQTSEHVAQHYGHPMSDDSLKQS